MSPILALSSYGLAGEVGPRYPPVREFVREIGRFGVAAEEVRFHHARSLEAHAAYLRDLPFTPRLVYACGSSVMEVAAKALEERGEGYVPIVYWGSHIEDGGEVVNPRPRSPSIRGVELPMPLYHSHRQFRLLKRLFPNLEQVHCVFSIHSSFIRGPRRLRYQRALALGSAWIPAGSALSAFPSLGRLGELIDVALFEHPCAEPGRAAEAVRSVPRSARRARDAVRACIVSCIDCLHVDGAVEQMAEVAHERCVPFIGLNFGGFLLEHGPVVSFESDIEGAGRLAARMALDVLGRSDRPAGARLVVHDEFLLRSHPTLADDWGIRLSGPEQQRIRRSFGRTFTGTREEIT